MNARLRSVRSMLKGLVAFVRYTNSVNDTQHVYDVSRCDGDGAQRARKR
jgi:hypothetical protein